MLARRFFGTRRLWSVLTIGCIFFSSSLSARAQDSAAGDGEIYEVTAEPDAPNVSRDAPEVIGGGSEHVGSYYYTSPLKKVGSDLFFGVYALNAFVSLGYLASVYPIRAISGSSKVEPVLLWMLLPIVGPWFAQYEDSVKSKLFWRVVLIGDSALQVGGIVVGLIGLALSGKRKFSQRADSGIELNLGVAGGGLAGLTLSVHNL